MRDLATLRFLDDAANALFVGPPGVGKTMLAVALARGAAEAGARSTSPPPPTWPRKCHKAALEDWDQMGKDLKPVDTAPTDAAAAARFEEFAGTWGARYPGDHRALALDVVGVRAVPRLRRGKPGRSSAAPTRSKASTAATARW